MSSSGSFLLFGIVGSVTLLFCSCTGPEPAITEPAIEPAAIQAEPRRAGEEPMSSQEPPAPEPAVEPPQEAPPVEQEQLQEEPPAEQELDESTIVAKIGEYAITRGELEQRVLIELADDHREDQANTQEPFDVNSVLVEMLAEKAMIIEGRDQNLLEGDSRIKQYKDERLASLLMQKELEGRIVVTDAEIDATLKAEPKLDRRRAEAAVRGKKQRAASDAFYEQLCKKLRLEKVRHNFPKVAQIHQRLLLRPQGERKQWWITNQQIKEEITPQEKQIVLATFDGGEVNLSDWFETLNRYSPPRRPKDLNTIQGVERLVDATVRLPVLVREAQLRGLDKDETYVRTVMEREDETLLTRVRRQTDEGVPEPTEEEIRSYFETHKEEFATPDKLKIEQIWCPDYETAMKAKRAADGGGEFGAVREEYSLAKEGVIDTSSTREGIFFKDLWAGEPNDVLGPVKGVYREGRGQDFRWNVRWRIVKVLQKRPGEVRQYSDKTKDAVKRTLVQMRRDSARAEYAKELLKRHQYKVYADRLRGIDPLNIQ